MATMSSLDCTLILKWTGAKDLHSYCDEAWLLARYSRIESVRTEISTEPNQTKIGAIGQIFSVKKGFGGQCEIVINCMGNVGKLRQLIVRGSCRNWTQSEYTKQYSKNSNEHLVAAFEKVMGSNKCYIFEKLALLGYQSVLISVDQCWMLISVEC